MLKEQRQTRHAHARRNRERSIRIEVNVHSSTAFPLYPAPIAAGEADEEDAPIDTWRRRPLRLASGKRHLAIALEVRNLIGRYSESRHIVCAVSGDHALVERNNCLANECLSVRAFSFCFDKACQHVCRSCEERTLAAVEQECGTVSRHYRTTLVGVDLRQRRGVLRRSFPHHLGEALA